MLSIVRSWVDKYFSDEEALVLLLLLSFGLAAIVYLGQVLAPVIGSAIIAFILQGMVTRLIGFRVPKQVAILSVFMLFLGFMVAFLFGLVPLLWKQMTSLVRELPRMFTDLQAYIKLLPEQYPAFVSDDVVNTLYQQATGEAAKFGQVILSYSLESFPILVAILIYLVLVPILVFFFLKDKDVILDALANMLPNRRGVMTRVWHEMNMQFANYIRGKVVEIFVVGGATYIAFILLGLNYAALLAILVGLSVVIPYIGATLVTIPVVMIGLFQWGWGSEFISMIVIYGVIQAIDGNILVPLLFSEVVNLHPVMIIVAVLVFGGIWGVWGVFFAIPLATMLKAILSSWPTAGKNASVEADRA